MLKLNFLAFSTICKTIPQLQKNSNWHITLFSSVQRNDLIFLYTVDFYNIFIYPRLYFLNVSFNFVNINHSQFIVWNFITTISTAQSFSWPSLATDHTDFLPSGYKILILRSSFSNFTLTKLPCFLVYWESWENQHLSDLPALHMNV